MEDSNFTFRRLLLIQASRELHDADSNNKSWGSKKTAITAKKHPNKSYKFPHKIYFPKLKIIQIPVPPFHPKIA